MGGAGVLVVLIFYALIAYVLYWVVRMGVRHGIQDADRRRDGGAQGMSRLSRFRQGARPPRDDGSAD